MKKVISILVIAVIVVLFFFSYNNVKKYSYLKSNEFINDMAALEFCILGYVQTNTFLPKNFNDFLPEGEKLLPDDHPNKPSDNFYKLNIELLQKDSMIILYLHGSDNDNDQLAKHLNVKDIKLFDIFFFDGDLVVDTLVRAQSFFGGEPAPLPETQSDE